MFAARGSEAAEATLVADELVAFDSVVWACAAEDAGVDTAGGFVASRHDRTASGVPMATSPISRGPWAARMRVDPTCFARAGEGEARSA